MMVTYGEHLEFLIRDVEGCRAELQGFRDAKSFAVPVQYSNTEYLQRRYLQGFQIGKDKLKVESILDSQGGKDL